MAVESRLERAGWSALGYRPFRVFLLSMLAATSGNFMYFAALGWYVLKATDSPAAVGLTFTATGLPILFLSTYAGVLTDRVGTRMMLRGSFVAMGALALAMAGSSASGAAPFALILVLAFGFGVAQAIGAPASVAIVSELVPAAAVSSATALNFLHMNAARIAGGLAGGVLLAAAPPTVPFVVAALLFAIPVVVMTRLRVEGPPRAEGQMRSALLGPLIEAIRYAAAYPTLGVLMLLTIAPGAIGLTYTFMLPVAAVELGIGAGGLGILMAAAGIGGLVAGLSLESAQRRIGHGRAVFGGLFGASVGLIGFGILPGIPLAVAALGLAGASFLTYGAASVTLIHALAPARMRGRMVSLFATVYWGMMPVGSLLVGVVAQATTARIAISLCGVGLAAAAALAAVVRPQILTLAVARDGRSVSGDLEGSGAPVMGQADLGSPGQ